VLKFMGDRGLDFVMVSMPGDRDAVWGRAGAGLKSAGSGWALHCGPGLAGRLGVWPMG
jgi:hypothetical protein